MASTSSSATSAATEAETATTPATNSKEHAAALSPVSSHNNPSVVAATTTPTNNKDSARTIDAGADTPVSKACASVPAADSNSTPNDSAVISNVSSHSDVTSNTANSTSSPSSTTSTAAIGDTTANTVSNTSKLSTENAASHAISNSSTTAGAVSKHAATTKPGNGSGPAVVSKAPTVRHNPLPVGWASTIDKRSGDIYYYHAGRQISQWERPTEADNKPLIKSSGTLDDWGLGDSAMDATPAQSGPATPERSHPNTPSLQGIGLDWNEEDSVPLTHNGESGEAFPMRSRAGSISTGIGTTKATSSKSASSDPWDIAAPAGIAPSGKRKKPQKPQTIIEEIIEAASRQGGDASYNSTATISDDRATELLEPIERYLNENYFPMKYQLAWLDFFLSQRECGGVFADDMGLGKTYSVWLAVLHDNPPGRNDRKTLLVANNHAVLTQWRGELAKFFTRIPSWYTYAWVGDTRWDEDAERRFEDAQVIITTKDVLVMDFQAYSPYWLTETSKNADGSSCVMYSPRDGEPQVNKANPKEDNHLIKRRREGRLRGRQSKLYARQLKLGLFDLVFVDEGDMIRAESEHTTPGQVRKRSWQAVWNLHCDRTWIMTGTPVNNNATGLLSLFELGRCGFSLPKRVQGLWVKDGSRMLTFMEQVRRLNWVQSNAAMVQALRILQKTNFIRRTIDMPEIQLQNADYGRPLPRCRYVDCPVTVGRGEDVYFSTVETNTTDALSTWLRMESNARYESWHRVWQGMTRARQVAALNPRIGLEPAGTADVTDFAKYPLSEKEKVILGICQAAVRKGEQVVVATLFIDSNVRLVELLHRHRISAERFDGKIPQKLRQAGMENFQSGQSSVMVMLMFAGGRGLNLQNASHLVLTAPWWNPVVLDQTRRRVWRVGSPHKVVTMYNVFYDISVEQWMLQTRVKSKMMLAASLMNEEAIYGGEEAISTQRSKKELSQTLQTQKLDEMWDFLSFLRAAPTARKEIRGVENVVWNLEMMQHELIGPRCRQMMISLFICAKRAYKTRKLPPLPLDVWKRVFQFLYGQDFAPVPEQKIESELEPEDMVSLVRQQNLQKLQDISDSLEECKCYLTELHIKRVSDEELTPEDSKMIADLLDKQRQLYQIRQLLDDPLASGLSSRVSNSSVLWLDPNPRMPQHGETSKEFMARAGPGLTKAQHDVYTSLQFLELTAARQADSAKDENELVRREDIGYMDDDPMLDGDDDADDGLMSEDEEMSDDGEADLSDVDEFDDEPLDPLNPAFATQIEEAMFKYLHRKPCTKDFLLKKMKGMLKDINEAGQARQADHYITAVLNRTCTRRMLNGEVQWDLEPEFQKGLGTGVADIHSAATSPVKVRASNPVAIPATMNLTMDEDDLFGDI